MYLLTFCELSNLSTSMWSNCSREDSWFSLYFHHSLRAFHSACIEDFANGSGCQVQESSFILFVIATMSLMHHVWWDGVVYYRRRNVVQNHRHPLHTLFIKLKFDAWCHTTQQAWRHVCGDFTLCLLLLLFTNTRIHRGHMVIPQRFVVGWKK